MAPILGRSAEIPANPGSTPGRTKTNIKRQARGNIGAELRQCPDRLNFEPTPQTLTKFCVEPVQGMRKTPHTLENNRTGGEYGPQSIDNRLARVKIKC